MNASPREAVATERQEPRPASATFVLEESLGAPVALEQVVESAVANIRTLLGAEAASVLLLHDDQTLRFATVSGGSEAVSSTTLAVGEGIAGWVAEHGEGLAIAEAQRDARFARRVDRATGFVTRTLAAAPLWLGDRLIGVLEAVNRCDGGTFAQEDALRLEALGRQVANTIANAITARHLHLQNAALEDEVAKRMRQVVVAKEEWLQTIDGIEDPILMVEEGGRVRRANKAASSWSGTPVTRMPGRLCHDLLFGSPGTCEGCDLMAVWAQGKRSFELGFRDRIIEVIQSPIVARVPGDARMAVCTYRDVTEARAIERRLQATEAMASVGRLAAGMAHEINNPVGYLRCNLHAIEDYLEDAQAAAIRLAAGAIDADPAKGAASADLQILASTRLETREVISECVEATDRVTAIVEALRVFAGESLLESGQMNVIDALGYARAQVVADHPAASIEVCGDPTLCVQASASQLLRVFDAVMRNGVQAGGAVEVSAWRSEVEVVVTIEDDGSGVPPEIRGHEFEPFVTSRRVGEQKGLGLGLSMAYAIVGTLGGRIGIEAREPRGTRVTVGLPAPPLETRGERS